MSYVDSWIRDLGARWALFLASFFVVVLFVNKRWSKLRKSCYLDYLTGFEAECSDLAETYKTRLFDQLHQLVSADDALRRLGTIRILEIGVKTGENLSYYPDKCHLICVDWNRKLKNYLLHSEHAWRFRHVILEETLINDGCCLTIPTGSVDAVVTTRALCSVRSQSTVLKEIHRVLAPNGIYLFMEHVVHPSTSSWIYWLQKFVSRTGIWPSLYGGCRPDSNPISIIENTGFEKVSWRRISLQGEVSRPRHLALTRDHAIGVARR